MTELPEELVPLKRFHGHLGPYVVIGYRMGRLARERFDGKMTAVVFAGRHPPMSCLIDGVQFTTGCTLGKNNIVVREGQRSGGPFHRLEEDPGGPAARFRAGPN